MIWPWSRRKPKTLGERGEDAAVRHLKRCGFQILERNIFLGKHEIDIIAREGDTIAFVEVKTRRTDSFADPEVNVTPEKQRRIRGAAHRYIQAHEDPTCYYRFDVVSVILPETGEARVTLHRDAFPDKR
ncbi:MAG: YraN family protein [Candidatus Hydrogenedentes bacterium]|nr:YraN family protein [Candidatus Hydrogenedentota bacterium]